ncbi:MAG: antitoxin [Oscillospiraceae bacterium]|nr:antitoxin [Oscillospiraceae bacterium]MBP3520707.1 antitoxin [Oscillospiraceae bacterium]
MKKIDEEGLKLCALQADVFENSLEAMECSSPIFIRRFMNSRVASRMDRRGFMLGVCDTVHILDEVDSQYGPTAYGKERYGREELYWLGYLYRYWAYTYEKSSKQVYKQMKAKDLRKLYYPYHSLDPAQAIERILEGSGSKEEDYTEKGVKIFRKILEREKKAETIRTGKNP